MAVKPIVVCFGASLTAGSISADYVELLQADPELAEFRFINHGVNGDLAWNGLQRLDKVIADGPDFVTILIGTNDVNCTLSERNRLRYVEFNHLPVTHPGLPWYEENLHAIVRRLKAELPGVRLALLSLAPIGEDPDHAAWRQMERYTQSIRQAASEEEAAYLPLNESMLAFLGEHEAERAALPPRLPYRDGLINIGNSIALHATGLSWDEISRRNGLLLLTDGLHLNSRGAGLIAGLIGGWLRSQTPPGGDT